jgi:hypothetical protein
LANQGTHQQKEKKETHMKHSKPVKPAWKSCPVCKTRFQPRKHHQPVCSRACALTSNMGAPPTAQQIQKHHEAVSNPYSPKEKLPPDPDQLKTAIQEFINSGGKIQKLPPSTKTQPGVNIILGIVSSTHGEQGLDASEELSRHPWENRRHPLLHEENGFQQN